MFPLFWIRTLIVIFIPLSHCHIRFLTYLGDLCVSKGVAIQKVQGMVCSVVLSDQFMDILMKLRYMYCTCVVMTTHVYVYIDYTHYTVDMFGTSLTSVIHCYYTFT